MGGLIALELSKKLYTTHSILPSNLFISAFRAPSLPHNREFFHTMPKEILCKHMYEMGGIGLPTQTTYDELELFLPTLYNDLKMCELYDYKKMAPLPCNFTILWGDRDDFIQKDQILLWQQESSHQVDFKLFSGWHFYIWDSVSDITSIINKKIMELL